MRVYVSSSGADISPQIRAYAEYRVFAAVARYPDVLEARVALQPSGEDGVECTVIVEDSAGATRATQRGAQVASTIDRAAQRIAELMRRRFQPEIAEVST